jgi:hypothetical protein
MWYICQSLSPHVIFGDTLANPTPSPLKCHVLFEWPLTNVTELTMPLINFSDSETRLQQTRLKPNSSYNKLG